MRGDVEDGSEAAGIVVAELEAVREGEGEVVVLFPIFRGGDDAEGAGHTEVHEDGLLAIRFQQEILGAALYGDECLAGEVG